jgi:hypothetical protein
MSYEPTYTDPESVDSHLGDTAGTCSEEEIRIAELDTDRALIAISSYQEDTGLKLDVDALTNKQHNLLGMAVAEQIKYRRIQGPEFFDVRQYPEATGEGFSRKGRRPIYSDAAREYLRRAGFTANRFISPNSRLSKQELRDLYFDRW